MSPIRYNNRVLFSWKQAEHFDTFGFLDIDSSHPEALRMSKIAVLDTATAVDESGRPPRNKLRFKHRWLISSDVVAALSRAGVNCNIIVPGMDPQLDGYDASLRKH